MVWARQKAAQITPAAERCFQYTQTQITIAESLRKSKHELNLSKTASGNKIPASADQLILKQYLVFVKNFLYFCHLFREKLCVKRRGRPFSFQR